MKTLLITLLLTPFIAQASNMDYGCQFEFSDPTYMDATFKIQTKTKAEVTLLDSGEVEDIVSCDILPQTSRTINTVVCTQKDSEGVTKLTFSINIGQDSSEFKIDFTSNDGYTFSKSSVMTCYKI